MKRLLVILLFIPFGGFGQSNPIVYILPPKTAANVYPQPDAIDQIGILYSGDTVQLKGFTGGYWKIKSKGYLEGYIMYHYINSTELNIQEQREKWLEEYQQELIIKQKEEEKLEKLAEARKTEERKKEAIKSEKLKKELNAELTKLYGSASAKRIMNNEIWIGMTKQMALYSIGNPERINKTVTKNGTSEQWVYHNLYLYFNNNILSTYQKSY